MTDSSSSWLGPRTSCPISGMRLMLVLALAMAGGVFSSPPGHAAGSPIQHVVIIYMENHSFDNILGRLCVIDARCDGATEGMTHDGLILQLARAEDIVPDLRHASDARTRPGNGRRRVLLAPGPRCRFPNPARRDHLHGEPLVRQYPWPAVRHRRPVRRGNRRDDP